MLRKRYGHVFNVEPFERLEIAYKGNAPFCKENGVIHKVVKEDNPQEVKFGVVPHNADFTPEQSKYLQRHPA